MIHDSRPADLLRRRFIPSDLVLAAVATAVGLGVRLPLTLSSSFPLGDGGLFFQMVEDVRRTFPAFPATTAYNNTGIPLVYPPLAIFLTAGIGNVLGASTADLLRFIPLVFSVLTVPAVYVLARRVLGTPAHAFVAAIAFASLQRSYDWLIDGGGLTRAPGLFLALLTLVAWWDAMAGFPRWRGWILAGIGLGATALTHPQAAILAAASMLVLLAFRGRGRWSVSRLSVTAAAAAAVLVPWLVVLLAIHGPSAFSSLLSAGQRWEPLLAIESLTDFDVLGGPLYLGPVMLGFAGLLACLLRGSYLLPVWAAVVFLSSAGGGNFLAMPVVALLIATFVIDVAIPHPLASLSGASRVRTVLVLAAVLAIALANGASATASGDARLRAVSPETRAAMEWVATNTPQSARFVVVEPVVWGIVGEWFPALAHRTSVDTLQGAEWLGRDRFGVAGAIATDQAACATQGADCFARMTAGHHLTDAYVFIPKGSRDDGGDCCLALRQGLKQSPVYSVSYDGPGASIFKPSGG